VNKQNYKLGRPRNSKDERTKNMSIEQSLSKATHGLANQNRDLEGKTLQHNSLKEP